MKPIKSVLVENGDARITLRSSKVSYICGIGCYLSLPCMQQTQLLGYGSSHYGGPAAFTSPVLSRRYYLGVNRHCAPSMSHLQGRGNANPHMMAYHIIPYLTPNAFQSHVTSLPFDVAEIGNWSRSREHHETISVVVILATNVRILILVTGWRSKWFSCFPIAALEQRRRFFPLHRTFK
jgi:hypothetical protein